MAQFLFDAAAVAETFKITVGCKTPIPPAVQPEEIVVYYPRPARIKRLDL
jgi:hypothetical protein